MVDSFTLQYDYEGFDVAYRPTPKGPRSRNHPVDQILHGATASQTCQPRPAFEAWDLRDHFAAHIHQPAPIGQCKVKGRREESRPWRDAGTEELRRELPGRDFLGQTHQAKVMRSVVFDHRENNRRQPAGRDRFDAEQLAKLSLSPLVPRSPHRRRFWWKNPRRPRV